jgi:hypothetical protein
MGPLEESLVDHTAGAELNRGIGLSYPSAKPCILPWIRGVRYRIRQTSGRPWRLPGRLPALLLPSSSQAGQSRISFQRAVFWLPLPKSGAGFEPASRGDRRCSTSELTERQTVTLSQPIRGTCDSQNLHLRLPPDTRIRRTPLVRFC